MSRLPHIAIDAFNAKAAAYLQLHRGQPTQPFIANVQCQVDAIDAGGVLFPVTVNHGELGNAWVCSPLTTYGHYAREEVDRLGRPWLAAPLRMLAAGFAHWLQHADIDRAVAINNWLVSTNAYPDLCDVDLGLVIAQARERWPGHALWFRSLNTTHHAAWLQRLSDMGGVLIPSRQVYLFDDVDTAARERTDLRRDLALLERHDAQGRITRYFGDDDFERAAGLYTQLYIDKYSMLNPRYGASVLAAWHRANLLELHGIRDAQGVLQGVVGMLRFGDLLTSPIVGYDTHQPARQGLYRMLAGLVLRQARRDRAMVNLSAGVAHFKRQRGGQPAIEYSAVLAGHMPARTRRVLGALGVTTRRVGVPLMRRYKW
ncbi:hypothetical protein [Dyella sp.]|uniref:hypothetical protein n=1 Tax=Dyella sp. TaxID=1869338 RepID=UPI002ED4F8F9